MLCKKLLGSICAVAFISLTACGGGGGSNSGGTVVPLPPTNSVPVARITLDKTTVDEGQSFTLDGAGSSDANGDALTYSWTQISGPVLDGPFGSDATLELTVPELTETGTATFQLQVSDGTLSDTARLDVTFANISQSPKVDFELMQTSTIPTQEGVKFVRFFGAGFREFAEIGETGSLDFFRVRTSDQNIPVKLSGMDSIVPISPDAVFKNVIGDILVDGLPFLAADEAKNLVEIVKVSENMGIGEVFQSGGQFNIEAPCAIETRFSDHVIIGQRDRGLSLLTLEYRNAQESDSKELDSANVEQVLSSGQSFCGFGFTSDGLNLFAVDHAAKTVSLFEILRSFGDGGIDVSRISFASEQILTLDLPADADSLEIVKTVNTGRGVLILLTDGQHDGSHHMIYVNYDDESFIQKRYSWPKGVPSDLRILRLFSDRTIGVYIASSTSSEAIVFPSPEAEFTELIGPQYLEVGLGANEVVSAKDIPFGITGLLVTFPEKNEIRFLSPR